MGKNISNNAIDVSRQHNKYIMLIKNREIMMVEANTAAAKLQIETQTVGTSLLSTSQAEADSVIIAAKAEKEALELKGRGESEYARLLESTELGNKLSLMRLEAESLNGLKNVCYIPSSQMNGLLDSRQTFAQNKLFPNKKPNDNELF